MSLVRGTGHTGSPGDPRRNAKGDTVGSASSDVTPPEPELLGIYLNDHLAGAAAGVRLARRLARGVHGSSMAEPVARLATEIEEDRVTLTAFMAELDIPLRRYKVYAAEAGELLARLKLNGHLVRRSPLSTVVELEALRLGIEGKASGWRTLRIVGSHRGTPDPHRLDALIERAHGQAAVAEVLRERAVRSVLGIRATV